MEIMHFIYQKFLKKAIEYIKGGVGRRTIPNDILLRGEQKCCLELEKCLDETRKFQTHWRLRDLQRLALDRDLQSPEDGVVYAWVDWKVG